MTYTNNRLLQAVLALLIIFVAWFMRNPNQQAPVWTVPYLSGAANLDWSLSWQVNPGDIDKYKSLPKAQRAGYRFEASPEEDLIPYAYNSIGFLFIVWLARSLFWWLGDVQAIQLLQILVHTGICLMTWRWLQKPRARWAFLGLYALNPLILYFVTFPFNHFWAVIPSVIATYLIQRQQGIPAWANIFLPFVLAFVFFTRPSVLLLGGFIFFLLYKSKQYRAAIYGLTVFAGLLLLCWNAQNLKNPWHTVYIGYGAYPNAHVEQLSDKEGMDLYKQQTGKAYQALPESPEVHKQQVEKYMGLLKHRISDLLRENPGLWLRNAVLNITQSYSLGYFNDYPLWVCYLSSITGALFMLALIYFKKYCWFISIGLCSLTFTLFYPPIQAYMFGAYYLIVLAFMDVLDEFRVLS